MMVDVGFAPGQRKVIESQNSVWRGGTVVATILHWSLRANQEDCFPGDNN
jgi:hypothetical protein